MNPDEVVTHGMEMSNYLIEMHDAYSLWIKVVPGACESPFVWDAWKACWGLFKPPPTPPTPRKPRKRNVAIEAIIKGMNAAMDDQPWHVKGKVTSRLTRVLKDEIVAEEI